MLTEPAAIQTICKSRKRIEGYSDSHGGFSVQFATSSHVGVGVGDVSSSGPDDESVFVRTLEGELGSLDVACLIILGRRGSLRAGERQLVGFPVALQDRKSTRLNSSHRTVSRMPSSA